MAITFLLGAAASRDEALGLAARFQTDAAITAAVTETGAAERAMQDRVGCSARQAERYQALAGAMLAGDPRVRIAPDAIAAAHGGLDRLWRFGVGDGAAVVTRVEAGARLDDLLRMLSYWRAHGVTAKVVALVAPGVAVDDVERTVAASEAGEVTVIARGDLSDDDAALLEARADLFVTGALPAIDDAAAVESQPAFRRGDDPQPTPPVSESLRFDNGYGGFSVDGHEYVMRLPADGSGRPPMPWSNVIANEHAGFLATEGGPGLAWSRNSRENRLTPWYNDPITDPHGEALFVRDEDGGVFWSPLPEPAPPAAPYEVRHGFGVTRWRHHSHDLDHEVVAFVPRPSRTR